MTTPQLFEAEYKGKTYNLSVNEWSKLLNRSPSFVHARKSLAKVQGHKNPMQFAIEEAERCIKRTDYKPGERMSATPARKTTIQEQFAADNRHLIDGFLYPSNCEMQEKREFV